MILGNDRAKLADGDAPQTLRSALYPVQIHGKTYNLYDTMGLKYNSDTINDNGKALGSLYRLVTDLSDSGGINLIVFVIKRGGLTRSLHQNYTLFHRGFCDSKVQIVMVITGCEELEPTMDTWWTENEPPFTLSGMSFADHACVCAFNGPRIGSGRHSNEDRFRKSKEMVSKLLVQRCMSDGWKNVRTLLLSSLSRPIEAFQFSNKLTRRDLVCHCYTYFASRKHQLSTPASTITSQIFSLAQKRKKLSMRYARRVNRSRISGSSICPTVYIFYDHSRYSQP